MFCSNCGKQLEDNTAFCPECGAKITVATTPATEEPAAPVVEKAPNAPVVTAPVAPTSTPQKPKKQNKGPIIAIIILALLVIALGIAIWWLYNDKKQDANEDWEETEAFAYEDEDEYEEEDEDEYEDEEEPTPEPTEEPTPEPTEEPTPKPTLKPTPEPTEAPTPKPTKRPSLLPTGSTSSWDDPIFDVSLFSYDKYSVYEAEMEVNGITIKDKQTIYAKGDQVTTLIESTSIDLSDKAGDALDIYVESYDETYAPIKENAPDSVEIIFGLDGDTYRFNMMIDLQNGDLKELSDAGYITFTSGSIDTATYISYDQTCAGLEAGGYTLVE